MPKHDAGRTPRKRVLMAGDENDNSTRWAQRALERLCCDVVRVNGSWPAVSAVHEGQFDLVLMDCLDAHVQGMAATHATQAIRAFESASERRPISIVGVASSSQAAEREALLESGMDHVLVRPVQFKSLALLLLRLGRR